MLSLDAWNCCKLELLEFFGVIFKQQCLNARELEAKETIPSWIWWARGFALKHISQTSSVKSHM